MPCATSPASRTPRSVRLVQTAVAVALFGPGLLAQEAEEGTGGELVAVSPPVWALSSEEYLLGFVPECPVEDFGPIERPRHIKHYVPPQWEEDPVDWVRDQDPQNKIDDWIDADLTTPTFDCLIAYRRPPTQDDVEIVESIGEGVVVQLVGDFLPFIAASGLEKGEIATLAADPDVGFIEEQAPFAPLSDVSTQSLKVAPGFYSPNTVEEAFTGIDGRGVNIVVMDSGVANIAHPMFALTRYYPTPGSGGVSVVGYNALTDTEEDPFDDWHHGTLVASVALGQQFTEGAVTARGMATRAGLIDVRIFDDTANPHTCIGVDWNDAYEALKFTYDKHLKHLKGDPTGWKVDIINMSFRQCDPTLPSGQACTKPTDGTEVFSQLVDLASAMGIVVVAAAGNNGCKEGECNTCFLAAPCDPIIGAPAASSRAIAVGALFDQATPNRADDDIACFSTPGPRGNDGDLDPIDELKPEVVAPGFDISFANFLPPPLLLPVGYGTSVASPHVAGLIALAKQMRPGLNSASARNLVIQTAEPNPTQGPPSLPAIDPIWNDHWGWGQVDAYQALVEAQPVADPQFVQGTGLPPWFSSEISIAPFPYPKPGIVNTVTAHVYNPGPGVATNVDVQFGVYFLSPTLPGFWHIGTATIPSILPGATADAAIQWKPKSQKHTALSAEIGFRGDADFTNNTAKHTFTVFRRKIAFPVQNLLSQAAQQIDLEVVCMSVGGGPAEGWSAVLEPHVLLLSGNERPAEVTLEVIPPPGTSSGRVLVQVAASIEGTLIGGMTLEGVASSDPGEGAMGLMDPEQFAQIVMFGAEGIPPAIGKDD